MDIDFLDVELIKAAHKRTGKNKNGLAKALGRQPSRITAMLQGQRRVQAEEVPVIVAYLGLNKVPVMGFVGAGATIEPDFEQVPPDGLDTVELPFLIPGELLAFRVRGDSMYPRYDDGDTVVVWREQRKPLSSFYGKEAAVRTRDGHRFLKTIQRGKGRGQVTLLSFNAKPIENVKLEWIGEIELVLRSGQAQQGSARKRGKG
jgi:repressor LexA